jgi:hypothetical protein
MSLPDPRRIRYSVRDILCLTAFLAVYMAAFVSSFRHGLFHDFDGKLVGLLAAAFVGYHILSSSRRSILRDRLQDGIRLPMGMPWGVFIFIAIVDFSFTTLLLTPANHLGVSGLAIAYYMLLLGNEPVAGKNGVCYSSGIFCWARIRPEYDHTGELIHLVLGNWRFWPHVPVPPQYRRQIEEWMSQPTSTIV